jgi:hypothetical protein
MMFMKATGKEQGLIVIAFATMGLFAFASSVSSIAGRSQRCPARAGYGSAKKPGKINDCGM